MVDIAGTEGAEGRAVGGPLRSHAASSRNVDALLRRRRHALVIGVDSYGHGVAPLEGARMDACVVANELSDERRADPYDVTLLVNEEATRAGVVRAFAALKAKLGAASGASALIYFAGHGLATALPEEAETDTPGYLLPQDARPDDPASFISMRDLRVWIEALGCHHLLLVLDCCFAGAFRWAAMRDVRATPRELYRERLARYLRDPAWHVLTSAAHDERAIDVAHPYMKLGGRELLAGGDADGARSPFAAAFVRGLRGDADFPSAATQRPDGVITVGELHTYIEHRFSEWESAGRRLQRPSLFPWPGRRDHKSEFVFLNPREALRLESAGELLEANNPYRGFRPFRYDPRDAAVFFGRNALVEKLVERVLAEPVVVVLGASGTGKSSLVAAGLLLKLAAAGWTPVCEPLRPGDRPMDVLGRLARGFGAAPGEPLAPAVWRAFERRPDARGVLVIDQLEELVTLRQGGDVRGAFLAQIDQAVEALGGRLRVVYTLRSDFEPHFERDLIARRLAGRFRVTPMSRDELREVIERPAEACVLGFTPPELVDAIVEEVIDAPGALPLLSFTLSEMYLSYVRAFHEGRRDDRALTREDYEGLGRVEGSLSRRAEATYESFDPATRATMRRVLLRMLSLEGGQPTRRPVPRGELAFGYLDEDARVERALAALTDARLVVREGELVEPAHDKIVLGWPRLNEWLNEPGERERVEAVRLVRDRAADWARLGRASGWLDQDTRLDRWVEILAGADPPFNALESSLVRESAARRQAARQTRRALVAVAFVVLAAFSVGLYIQQRRAVKARDEAVAARDEATRGEAVSRAAELRLRSEAPGFEEENLANALVLRRDMARRLRTLPTGIDEAVFLAAYAALTRVQLRGHTDSVTDAAFSPDGTRVVTASADHTARLWDARHGGPLNTFRGHTNRLNSVTFSPDGSHIATTSQDGTARLWDVRTGAHLRTVPDADFDNRVVFSPDGTRILTVSADTARIWDTQGGALLVTLPGSTSDLVSAAFSPDGRQVVAAYADATARIWDARSGTDRATLRGHTDALTSAEFSPDGARVVTSSEDATARIWDARHADSLAVYRGHAAPVTSATFSSDGRYVATASDSVIQVWEVEYGTIRTTLQGCRGRVWQARFSPNGTRVVAASEDATTYVWSRYDGLPLATLRGHTGGIAGARFAPDSARVVTASDDGTARIWSLGGSALGASLQNADDRGTYVAISRDGARVAVAASGGVVRVLDTRDGRLLSSLPDHAAPILGAAFSPDGARIVTVAGRTARVWNTADGTIVATFEGREARTATATFLPDGEHVLMRSDHSTIDVWDARTGQPVSTLRTGGALTRDGAFALAFQDGAARVWRTRDASLQAAFRLQDCTAGGGSLSRDATRAVTACDNNTVRVWDTRTGALLATLQGHTGEILDAALLPDGTRVVTASADHTARLWDVRGGALVATLQGHTRPVGRVAFSDDGARVLTSSNDGTVRVWNAEDGALLITLDGHVREGATAAFSPDGRLITVFSEDDARIWNLDPAAATREGCRFLRNRPIWQARADVRDACVDVVPDTPR